MLQDNMIVGKSPLGQNIRRDKDKKVRESAVQHTSLIDVVTSLLSKI